MRSNETAGCITRVVVDGHHELELVQLQAVMQQIQASLSPIPEAQRTYIGNALLNLAVCQILRDVGVQRAATILIRLVDTVLEQEEPPLPEAAINLSATHA